MGQGVVRMEGVATCFRDLGNILIIAIPWVYSSLSMPPFRLICSIVWQHICFLREHITSVAMLIISKFTVAPKPWITPVKLMACHARAD